MNMNIKKRMQYTILTVLLAMSLFGCNAQDTAGGSSLAAGDIAPQSSIAQSDTDTESTTNSEGAYSDKDLMYITGSSTVPLFKERDEQEILLQLKCGDTVAVSDDSSGDVTFVSIPNTNESGYVYSRYLVSDKNSVTAPFTAVIGENGAEVFSAEGGTGDVVDTVFFGDTVEVIAKTSGGYWRVLTDSAAVGYINIMLFMSDSLPTDIGEPDSEQAQNTNKQDTDTFESDTPSSAADTHTSDTSSDIISKPSSYSSADLLENAVLTAQAQAGGRWAAAYIDLQTGSAQSIGNAQMQAASLIKLYIMGAIYENYDTYAAQEDSLDSLLYSMITASDNAAANTLTGLLGSGDTDAGRAAVTSYAHSHGYYNTSMGRLLLESSINGDNYTSVDDCAKFLQSAYNGELPHSADMMSLLSQQTVTYKIPAGVPVRTANKTGELESVQNDAAVVYADRPYVLCVMSENVSAGSAIDAIVELSGTVYSSTS